MFAVSARGVNDLAFGFNVDDLMISSGQEVAGDALGVLVETLLAAGEVDGAGAGLL